MAEPAAVIQPQAYDDTGAPIAPDALPSALAAGKARFQQGARVYAQNAAGQLVTIAAEDVGHPGYTILTPAQAEHALAKKQHGEGVGNLAKAAAAGAARGLTLGASDAALTAIGGDSTRRALKGLREANPITSGVSEVAGAVAPVLLSGGSAAPVAAAGEAGALARVGGAAAGAVRAAGIVPRAVAGAGSLVERGVARGLAALGADGATLAGRVGATALKMGAQGAVEGALYGGAQAANDAVLNGDQITAEKIVAGMGHGALFGGAAGAGLGAAGALGSAAASKLIPKRAALEQLSREQAGRAAGFKASDYKALVGRARGQAAEDRIAATLDDLRNYEIKTGELAGQRILQPADSAEEILARVTHAKNETAAALGGLKDEISEGMQSAGYHPDIAALRRRIEENVFSPAAEGATPSIHRRIQKAREELAALEAMPAEPGASLAAEAPKPYAYEGQARPFDEVADAVEKSLSKAERHMVWDYTTTSYKQMNEAARDPSGFLKQWGSPTGLAEKQVRNAQLQTILEKEVAEGRVFRGELERIMDVPEATLQRWLEDGALSNESFWSTTANPEEFAKTLLGSGAQKYNVRLHITHADAVPVAKFSKVAAEQEAIIPPGRTFFVNKEETIDGVRNIWIEQVHSSEPSLAHRGLPVALRDSVSAEAQAPAAPLTFRQVDQMRQRLRETFQPPPVRGGGLPPPAPKNAAYLEGAEREIAAFLKEEAGKFLARAGEDPNAYNELNRRYHSFRQLEDVGTKATAHNLGNRMVSPSDHALGVASFLGALSTGNVGALGAMGAGAAATVANKLLRERGNSVVADMARRAAEMDNNIDRVAQVLAGKAERAKAPTLAAALEGENLRETYERTANRVRDLAVPQAAQAHIAALVPEVAAQYPLAGAAISTKLLQIYQQLQAKLPQSHVSTGATLTPLAVRERVAPGAMRSFLANVRGALEPEKVIGELAHGVVDREAVAALKTAHPLTFAQLRSKVADYVSERQDELPYKQRVMLSMTFDFIGDETLQPATLAGLQQTAQALSVAEHLQDQQMVKPKSGHSSGPNKAATAMTLPAQAAFSGDM